MSGCGRSGSAVVLWRGAGPAGQGGQLTAIVAVTQSCVETLSVNAPGSSLAEVLVLRAEPHLTTAVSVVMVVAFWIKFE